MGSSAPAFVPVNGEERETEERTHNAPRWETFSFCLLVLAHLVPVWIGPRFPSQDGPAHVENSRILRELISGHSALYAQFYELNRALLPNLACEAVLAPLLGAVSPVLAERILLSAHVLAFPLAVRWLIAQLGPRCRFLSMLAFPLIFNWTLYMGFYNFNTGVPALLLALLACLRFHSRPSLFSAVGLAAAALLAYFCHLVTFLVLTLVLGSYFALAIVWRDRVMMRRSGGGLLLLTPALGLLGLWGFGHGRETWTRAPVGTMVQRLFSPLVAFREEEGAPALLLLLVLLSLAALGLRTRLAIPGRQPGDPLLVALVVFFAAYFAAPASVGDATFVHARLALFAPLLLLLWLGTLERSALLFRPVLFLGFLLSAAFLALRTPVQLALASQLQDYVDLGESIPAGTTLLPLNYVRGGFTASGGPITTRVDPLLHGGAAIAAERGLVELANYQAGRTTFPTRFRTETDPYLSLGPLRGLDLDPPCVDLENAPFLKHHSIDFVLTWGLEDYERRSRTSSERARCIGLVRAQIRRLYVPVTSSRNGAYGRLYRRAPAVLR